MVRSSGARWRYFARGLAFGLLACLTPHFGSAQPVEASAVAVFDIQPVDVTGATPGLMAKYTSYLDSVVAANGFRTVPRSEMQAQLVEQQKESYRNCYDESCQIELGKAVSAQKTLSSTWSRLGEVCVLSVKLYDLKTSLAEFSAKSVDGPCNEAGLRAAIDDVAQAIRARGQQGYGAFTIDLNAGRDIKNPPTDKTGYLKIKAVARGRDSEKIQVRINGDIAGTVGNGLFTKELKVGRYVVILSTAGGMFAPQRFDIEMTTSGVQLPKEGTLQLEPTFGTLTIDGSPAQATLLINGEPRALNGTFREERRIGRHTIVVEAPGYLAKPAQEVTIEPGRETHITYDLVRNAGSISVVSSPAGARVVIDGVAVGRTTPTTLGDVEVGDHVVEVSVPGHRPERRVTSVTRGETASVDVTLGQKLARLKVESVAQVLGDETPIEADVWLDGVKRGTTPWKSDVLAEVKHRLQLRLGDQSCCRRVLELPEGREQREVLVVPESWGGAVSSLRFSLVPGPWEVRSGPSVLKVDEPNPVRPGRVPVEFLLDGKMVGRVEVVVSPDEHRVITVTSRPKTPAELEGSMTAWRLRKWISLGLAMAAGAVGTERLLAAQRAETDRNSAWTGLANATTASELDSLRAQVVDQESARGTNEIIGRSVLGGAAALLVWSTIEWVWGEPDAGDLVGDEVGPVTEGP